MIQPDLFGMYRTISLDPPWLERGGGKSCRGAQRHYPLMPTAEIIDLVLESAPVGRLAPSAHCWIWVTDNFLEDGLQLMRALGFRYVRTLCWVKVRSVNERRRRRAARRMIEQRRGRWVLRWCSLGRPPRVGFVRLQVGLGQYLRGSHELCLFGVRGDAMVPPPSRRRPSVVFASRGRHSAKPDAAYAVIGDVSPGPRVEMFARVARPGWDAWGNEAPVAA
jgi:N6-adenosine-specific RNA methylase IME4